MNELTIEAPAKINIGLEILGRRPDGYHEIRTILAMLDLADTLTVSVSDHPGGMDIDGVPADENLVSRALAAFNARVPGSPPFSWRLIKRIPSAAGLGGASSDAAAALVAGNVLSGSPLVNDQLMEISETLGSDIAFFLGDPCALASGRGTDLSPLPAIGSDVLLIVPRESLPSKTAIMYGNLTASDFSPGERVAGIVAGLKAGKSPAAGQVTNAFSRPLREAILRTGELQRALESNRELTYGVSGAGPAHYVLAPKVSHGALIEALTARFGDWLSFISTSTRRHRLNSGPGSSS